MSGNDKNTSFYSASDIQKYLRGELSAPEMHRLEKAALEDPFLADALEGMEIHHSLPSAPSFQEDMNELQQRLNDRVAQKDSRSVLSFFRPAWKIAAVIILLVGLSLTAWFTFLNQTGREPLSMVSQKSAHRSIAPADSVVQNPQPLTAPVVAASDKTKQEIVKDEERSANKTAGSNDSLLSKKAAAGRAAAEKTGEPEEQVPIVAAKKSAPPQEMAITKETIASQDQAAMPRPTAGLVTIPAPESTLYNKSLQAVRIERSFKKEVNASDNYNTDSLRYRRSSTPLSNGFAALDNQPASPGQFVITGKVTDLNNNALSGASLRLKGNYMTSTVTDKYGNFSLTLPKQDSPLKLTVASIGYEQASLELSTTNRTGNLIQLQPQAVSLNEVVVTGFGDKRKEILKDNSEPKKEGVSLKAVPANGWSAYNSYLEAGKKAQNPDSTLKGNETISFIVNKEGALSSFKVEHSLSPAHDSLTIRLIQQGPRWKLLKGKKTRTSVTLSF